MMGSRTDYISDLNEYISSSKSVIQQINESLGWDNQALVLLQSEQDNEMVSCLIDNNHRVPRKYSSKHIESCSLRKDGYSDDSIFLPPACTPGPNSIVIDKATLNDILQKTYSEDSTKVLGTSVQEKSVPLTSDRLFSDFTASERLALYDYTVQNTSSSEQNYRDVTVPIQNEQGSKPKTLEELLAAERDAKRRRIRYKAKKVHTNRKSQTEIIREVIQSNMEGYEEWLKQEKGICIEEFKKKRSRSRSVESKSKDEEPNEKMIEEQKVIRKQFHHHRDDWNYYGVNPHKRFHYVLKEDNDKEYRAKQRKSLKEDDYTRRRDYKGDKLYNSKKEYHSNTYDRNSRETCSDTRDLRDDRDKYSRRERSERDSRYKSSRDVELNYYRREKVEKHSSKRYKYDEHRSESNRSMERDIKEEYTEYHLPDKYEEDYTNYILKNIKKEKGIDTDEASSSKHCSHKSNDDRYRDDVRHHRKKSSKKHKHKKKHKHHSKKKHKRHLTSESDRSNTSDENSSDNSSSYS